jgi:peptidoglycan-N-acetylglucosamine deacetylase
MASEKKDVKVALTFDFDACCVWIGTLGAKSPSMISRGEYLPAAVSNKTKVIFIVLR